MSNLRQIGQGVMMYANDNKGDVPPDLGATARYLQTPTAYVTADHVGVVPPALAPDELGKWVNANSDYVYVGKGLGKINVAAPDKVIAHEKFELSKNGLTNVLFGDGHVEMQATPVARDRVRQQLERQMKAKDGAAQ
jgi:prepilin-type processing-associated H-X9-DG protein